MKTRTPSIHYDPFDPKHGLPYPAERPWRYRVENETDSHQFFVNELYVAQTYRDDHEKDFVAVWLIDNPNADDLLVAESSARHARKNA